jgi:DNA-binding response OmpR family regulator
MISTNDWKVLLVDDEVEFVSALEERLRMRGIQAEAVHNGEKAIEKISIDPPEVVILDVVLPGVGGLEVLKWIKRDYPSVKIVLLTGRGVNQADIKKGISLGAASYFIKPVKIEELIVEVLDILEVPKTKKT